MNWSGYVLSGGAPYDVVNGRWAIPPAIGELPGVSYTYSLLWVGLDGYGTADVVQAGTGQDGFVLPGVFPTDPVWVVSSYYAWTEIYPLPLQRITNFHVDPGDDIFSAVWVGNPGEAPSAGRTFGFFQMEDLTKSHYTGTPIPPGTTFTGSSAEWIMERPKLGNYLPPLANYGSASMSNAYAHRAGGPWIPSRGDSNSEIWMFEGSDLLSTVSPVDLSAMAFSWHNFR